MGFYSIYKIIKDMIRTLFGNKFLKLLIIIIIIFTFVFLLDKGVFASFSITNDINSQDFFINDTFINKYPYYCFCTTSNGEYIDILCSNSPITTNSTNPSSFAYYTYYNSSNTGMARIGGPYSSVQNSLNNSTFPNINTNVNQLTTTSYGAMRVFYSNHPIKNKTSGDTIIDTFVSPSLGNTQQQLENLSFTDFIINANSFTLDMINNSDEPLVLLFYNRSLGNSSNTDSLYPIKEKYFYKESIYFDENNSTDSNYIFNYPIFRSGVFFNIGSTYEIKLAKRVYIQEYNTWGYDYFDTSYTFTVSSNVTQDYINQLNQQTATSSDEEQQQELQSSINQQTQSIDNINNSITDSTVDNSSIDLPTDNTQDPTQSGVDNIFQTIYNSFTSGTAQDIIFPIPFSNNNLVIQANYVSNMLGSTQAGRVIISLIQAYYWYLISRFIITDIMRKIRKIKQGNFENIQNSNIKEDML